MSCELGDHWTSALVASLRCPVHCSSSTTGERGGKRGEGEKRMSDEQEEARQLRKGTLKTAHTDQTIASAISLCDVLGGV